MYWCTADIGWVTGHSYVVYGPLANGATVRDVRGRARLAAEGSLLGDHRALRRDDLLHRADGDSRVHAVGRRVAEAARSLDAAAARLGRRADQPRGVDLVSPAHRRRALPDRRHVVADRDRRDHDHAAAGHHDARSRAPRRAPFPGITAEILNDDGRDRSTSAADCSRSRGRGRRCCAASTATRALRRRSTWSRWRPTSTSPATAPSATRTAIFWLLGRVDDVLNVAGHRIGTMEVESALVDHPRWRRPPSSGAPHEIKGQAVAAFVTLQGGRDGDAASSSSELKRARRRRRSARSRGRTTSSSPPICRRRAPARSCAGCCATSPKAGARRHDDAGGSGGRGDAEVEVQGGLGVGL